MVSKLMTAPVLLAMTRLVFTSATMYVFLPLNFERQHANLAQTDHKIDASCWYLADYVLNIYNTCNDPQCGLGLCRYNGVCGQRFDTDGYNVIVRRDNDC